MPLNNGHLRYELLKESSAFSEDEDARLGSDAAVLTLVGAFL